MQTSSVALAGAAVLAMASGTEAFAPSFVTGGAPTASLPHGLSSCRQAPGRMASLRMVLADPPSQVRAVLPACA